MRSASPLVVTFALLACAALAAGPIPWTEAGNHVGDNVTVEGDVLAASSTPDQVVLEFAPADPKGFRVVLIVPIMTDLPRFPERLYQGKRVRAAFAGEKAKDDPFAKVRIAEAASDIDAAWRQLSGNVADEYALLAAG